MDGGVTESKLADLERNGMSISNERDHKAGENLREKTHKHFAAQAVTPECRNRGSSKTFAWIPDKSIRE